MAFRFSVELKIDDKLRKELGKPFGKIIKSGQLTKEIKDNETVYAIGDVTVAALLGAGIMPKLAIFDYRTGKDRKVFPIIKKTYKKPIIVKNRRGTINLEMWNAIKTAIGKHGKGAIRVDGEEDLGSLVCINFAQRGSVVIYGLRGRGMALIRINNRIKKYVETVLAYMRQSHIRNDY